jgi:hypothetical protein
VKRGLITWSPLELPRAVLDARVDRVREALAALGAPAALVPSDVWRSNHVRALVNFMPFWSRSLLVVPAEGDSVLICGHSPRVYPWVRTLTVAELRPGGRLAESLLELVVERGWRTVAAVDRRELPWDVHSALAASGIPVLDLPSRGLLDRADDVERAMRTTSVETTRRLVEEAIDGGGGLPEQAIVARLERGLRRGGMEDVVVWLGDGNGFPRPSTGALTGALSSVVVAAEYRGHWAHVARPLDRAREARDRFVESLNDTRAPGLVIYDLASAHPFRALAPGAAIEPGRIVAVHARTEDGRYYGDTCTASSGARAEIL